MLGNSIQLIGKEKNYYMEQYKVKGMSCAACSARVEKAVYAVDGVTACTVSLLTNSMSVEGTADAATIIRAVEKAGYKASKMKAGKQSGGATDEDDALKDTETPLMRKRLIASVVLLIPLMYVSMGHMMWNWPLPPFFESNHVAMGLVQLLFTKHGHARSTWFCCIVYLQCVCTVCNDRCGCQGTRDTSHALHA